MSYLELKNPKTEKYLSLVQFIKSQEFPWYFFNNPVSFLHKNNIIPWYSHCVLSRGVHADGEPIVNSFIFDTVVEVLNEIFEFNLIKVKKLYRINVNATHNLTDFIAPPHVDHSFPHQQMLIYLNDLETSCPTYLFREKYVEGMNCSYFANDIESISKDFTLDDIIQPKENKIITFDGLTFHSYSFPKNNLERRLCIVVTYCPL